MENPPGGASRGAARARHVLRFAMTYVWSREAFYGADHVTSAALDPP